MAEYIFGFFKAAKNKKYWVLIAKRLEDENDISRLSIGKNNCFFRPQDILINLNWQYDLDHTFDTKFLIKKYNTKIVYGAWYDTVKRKKLKSDEDAIRFLIKLIFLNEWTD